MRRLHLILTFSIPLAIGCGSSSSSNHDASSGDDGATADVATGGSDTAVADGSGGADTATVDGGTAADAPGDDGGAGDGGGSAGDGGGADGGISAEALQGKYLVGILGCAGCHTPKAGDAGAPDPTMTLAGVDCFVSTPGCLSSANLTPDNDTGLGKFSDQAIIDAFRTGKDPDPAAGGAYLFARMPYYQFANLNDTDAHAIVAYLRSLPPVKHAVKEANGPFNKAPTSPEWTPVDPAKLPAPGAGAPADAAHGKYLAQIICVTCHSPAATGTPLHVDETTAFQGGQSATTTAMGMMMMFQSANLTPDMTGIKGWSAMNVATAIKTAKDKDGKTLCSPMRANAAMTDADATAIADYLLSVPPVAHAVTACPTRM